MCARYPIYSNSTLLPVRGELLELAQHILEQMEVDAANEGGARLEIDRQMVGYHALHDPHATQFRDAGLSLSPASSDETSGTKATPVCCMKAFCLGSK